MNPVQTDNTIQSYPYAAETNQFRDKLHNSLESGKQSAVSCCAAIRKESNQICETTADGIRKNPIASVVGAAFVGAAVCYLILEGRSQPTFRDRYLSGPISDASDKVSDSLGSAFNSLKFW